MREFCKKQRKGVKDKREYADQMCVRRKNLVNVGYIYVCSFRLSGNSFDPISQECQHKTSRILLRPRHLPLSSCVRVLCFVTVYSSFHLDPTLFPSSMLLSISFHSIPFHPRQCTELTPTHDHKILLKKNRSKSHAVDHRKLLSPTRELRVLLLLSWVICE